MKLNIKCNEKWLKAALIRAIKTFAQTFLATVGSATIFSAVDWKIVFSTAGLAAVLSIITSLAGIPEAKDDEPEVK